MSNMVGHIKTLAGRFYKWLKGVNPLLLAGVLFLLSIIRPGEYSVWNQLKYNRVLDRQEREIRELKENIRKVEIAKKELRIEKDRLEKFAREKYLMKEEDEEIYLIK
ncbi:MAG: septum formation initiator family protein [Porphyromonas sp.]|nr:septum formation initiator family protein [Porphyromonas sp.]